MFPSSRGCPPLTVANGPLMARRSEPRQGLCAFPFPSSEASHDAYPSLPAARDASAAGTFRPGPGPWSRPSPPSD